MIAREVLFLFSALGAINGLLLAVYFFSRRPGRIADRMLGALLLAVSVRTAKSTVLFFHPGIALEFRQLGLSACLLIGPLTYLTIRSQLGAGVRHWRWHLGLCALVIGIGVAFPYSSYRAVWDRSSYAIHIFWLAYLLASGRALWQSRHVLKAAGRAALLPLSVFIGSCVILAAYASTPLTSYIVGALSLTFSIHITILIFMLRRESDSAGVKEKYRNKKLAHDDAMAVLASLEEIMSGHKLYLNPNLSLAQLAKRVGQSQAAVSQVLNDKLDKTFNAYVNEYRIAEAKRLLADQPHLSLDIVAERCGFNSNSTFFAAFKKVVGQTPASFRAGSSQPVAGGSA